VYQAYRNAIPQSAFLQSKKRLRRQLANFSSGARLTWLNENSTKFAFHQVSGIRGNRYPCDDHGFFRWRSFWGCSFCDVDCEIFWKAEVSITDLIGAASS